MCELLVKLNFEGFDPSFGVIIERAISFGCSLLFCHFQWFKLFQIDLPHGMISILCGIRSKLLMEAEAGMNMAGSTYCTSKIRLTISFKKTRVRSVAIIQNVDLCRGFGDFVVMGSITILIWLYVAYNSVITK
jgi:hypothetical protein